MQSPSDKKPNAYAQMLAASEVPAHPTPGMVPTQEPAGGEEQAPKNYFDLLGTQQNPFAAVMTPTDPAIDATSVAGSLEDHPSFGVKHPLINEYVVRPVKQVASGILWLLMNPQPRSDLASYEEVLAAAQRTRQFSLDHPEFTKEAMRGAALVASFLPSTAAAKAAAPLVLRVGLKFGPRALTGAKVASFLSGEFLGGATYGAIEPLEEGQSRASQIVHEGIGFAVAGGAIGAFAAGGRALATGYRKYIIKYLGKETTQRAIARLAVIEAELGKAGTSMDALPPRMRDEILANVYRDATEQAGANPLHVEGFLDNEMRSFRDQVQTSPEVESLLPDPDQPFAFAKPMPLPRPEGFMANADRPLFDAVEIRVPDGTPVHPADLLSGKRPPRAGIVSRNPKTGELPWRISFFQNTLADKPWGHRQFQTKEEAFRWAKDRGFAVVDQVEKSVEGVLQPTAENAPKRLPSPRKPKGFEATANEFVITSHETKTGEAVVRGRSGKLYKGITHPQAMADAINSGVPASEFEGARGYKLEENMGFSTNLREFVGREEAGRIADKAEQRSANLKGHKLDSTHTMEAGDVDWDVASGPSSLDPSAPTTGFPPEALADIAVDEVVNQTPLIDMADNEVKIAVREAKEPPIVPGSRVDPMETVTARQGPTSLTETSIDDLNIAARMHDKEIEELQREFMRIAQREPHPVTGLDVLKDDLKKIGKAEASFAEEFARKMRGESGAASINVVRLIARAGLGAGGVGVMVHASDEKDPGWKNIFYALGGMMVAASMYGPARTYLKAAQAPGKFGLDQWTRNITKNFLLNAAPTFLMKSAGSKEGFRRYIETLTWSRELAHGYRDALIERFPAESHRAAQISIDELNAQKGTFPMEFWTLTKDQQKDAIATNQFNTRLLQMMRREGVEADWIQNYARQILPEKTFNTWMQQGVKQVGPNAVRRLSTLREFEQFAAAHRLPAPIVKMPDIQALRITEAYRAAGAARNAKMLKGLGVVSPAPTTVNQAMPLGWVVIKGIPSLRGQMAPEAVAKALQNIASPIASHSDVLNAADVIKSTWMRSIMFWFWEHGANALRAAALLSNNPWAAKDAIKLLFTDNQAAYLEAAKHGLNTRARTDYGLRSAKAFEEMAQKVGKIPLIGSLWRGGGALIEKQDRLLWDRIIPSMQLFAYNTEMKKWADRTAGKFLPGSAEYTAAARKAADFANVVFGRMPTELANPQMLQFMRLAMFSPQWTSSRIALTMGAAGELGEIAAGRMNPFDGQYLPFKIRQVAMAAAVTWGLSKLLSGQKPEFNPNTGKFYAKTGLRNGTGREVGIDVLGWWQDDLKLFNDPIAYLGSRLNPVFKVGYETVTGRDYAGRDMTHPQQLENLLRSFGPPAEAAELAARVIGPGPHVSSGELAQRLSGVSATFNVATLPRPIDATIARFAEKLLVQAHLPKNEYMVFELSRLLRSNILSGQSLIDNRVVTYLSYRQRGYAVQHPLNYDAGWLWDKGRNILAGF